MKQLFFVILAVSLISCKQKTSTEVNVSTTGDTIVNTPVSSGPDGEYIVDSTVSVVKWRGFKPTGEHHGIVPVASGKLTVANGVMNWGIIEMEMANLTVQGMDESGKQKLEAHLKGIDPGKEDDFFNVDQYPKSIFIVNSVSKLENDPDGNHMINGTLTVKDVSKPVSFKAKVNIDNNGRLTATTPEFAIDRTEFGIKFKSKKFFDNLRDDFINDEFKLQIDLVANKRG